MKAYSKGYKLLLDEINLAKKEVLECIQQAIDNKTLSFDCNGRGYVNISIYDNFSIIATQNRFEKIYSPNFDKN